MANNKILKVCLAMGGGVSLGSYSGAALTEALKLLVLFGHDKDGNTYSSIELDGMSGASAGAMSLAIMMRCLIDYKSMLSIPELGEYFLNDEKNDIEKNIEKRLIDTYGNMVEGKNLEILKALEVTQAVQKLIWVDGVDSLKLISTSNEKSLKPFALLSRNQLLVLVKKYLLHKCYEIDVNNKQLISDRVLMAFSISNLTPFSYSDKINIKNKGIPQLVNNLLTATNINCHNEMRVIDFAFKPISENHEDTRYLKIREKSNLANLIPDIENNIFEITKKETWATISASAMASGAFTVAFEPVILKRYRSEYSKFGWITSNEFNTEEIKELNFAYVDGGTFNNEPIKEAFKIGAFHDFQSENLNLEEDEDRLILFVDPSVPDTIKIQQLESLDPLSQLKNNENHFKGDSSKFIGIGSDILGMILGQSKINEEAKVASFYKSAKLNGALLNYFVNANNINLKSLIDSDLLKSSYEMLNWSLKERQISIGTRKVSKLIWTKYRTISEKKNLKTRLTEEQIKIIYDLFVNFLNETTNPDIEKLDIDIQLFLKSCNIENGQKDEIESTIASSFFTTIGEIALNQSGKNVSAERAGIFPIDKDFKIEDLPGSEMSAFGGFASIDARNACFEKGRIDSIRCLISKDFREYHYNSMLDNSYENLSGYLGANNLNELENNLTIKFSNYKEKWENNYEKDVLENFRKPFLLRIFFPIADFLKSKFKLLVIFNGFFVKKILGNSFSEEKFIDSISKTGNIAIKFKIDKITNKNCNLILNFFNNEIPILNLEFENSEPNFHYFKLYLAPNKAGIDMNNVKFIDSCYITNQKLRFNDFKLPKNEIRSITFQNGKDKCSLEINNLLSFFESNKFNLIYGINPLIVLKMENGNLVPKAIDSFSKSLDEEILAF